MEVAVGEREQAEHRTPEHALGEGADGGAVVRDAGGGELLVHEPGVGLGGAVEDRHPLERHAVDERGHHQPDRGAYFVVGIGRRNDLGAVRRLDGTRIGREVERRAERATATMPGIGALHAGDTGDDRERRVIGHRAQQRGAGQRQVLRQVEHDRAEVGEHGAAVVHRGDGGVHQVALVVPLARERAARGAVHAHDLGRAPARAREPVERGVVALRQLAVRVDERLLGGGVLRDRGEHARLAREHAADRGTEHGRGHGAAPGRRRAAARRASPRPGTR